MRLRRLAAGTVLVLGAVGLLATGCTSTANEKGHPSRPNSSAGASSPAPGTATSGPLLSSSPAPITVPPGFARTPVATAIGDPGTADLCSAVGADTFSSLGAGTATVDPVQYPPGCSFTLSDAGGPVLTVSVFAARHVAGEADGRTKRRSSGLVVYSYPFDSHTGSCRRDVLATGVRLVADAISRGSAQPHERLSCAASDAMADRLAHVAASGSVPRLSLAQPSVTQLSACAIVKQAGITTLGAFASGQVTRRGFAVNCEVRVNTVFLFINAALAADAPPTRATAVPVAGHVLYRTASRSGFCSYVSVQGATGDGQHEEVTAAATVSGSGQPPPDLCDQTAQALARYLTTAGLT